MLLSLVRRFMPTIIAEQLVGVQSMKRPLWDNDLWDMDMNKEHYQHFLRLNNRKKYHKITDISDKYKYPFVKVSARNASNASKWCKQNLKPGSYVFLQTRFCFAYEQDASWFGLVWD